MSIKFCAKPALVWLTIVLISFPAFASDGREGSVEQYEARLEKISREIAEIRQEFEDLITEVAAGETGRVFIFIEKLPQAFFRKVITLSIDDKKILFRNLAPAELDILEKGLPVQLADLRLPPGKHTVLLDVSGMEQPKAMQVLELGLGEPSWWVAAPSELGVEWRTE